MAAIWEQWQQVTVAVLALVFVLLGLVYMIGIGFRLPKVQAWAKNEFYQAIANAIIVGGMLILLTSINGMLNSITGPPPCDACDEAKYPTFCDTSTPGGYAAVFDHVKCYLDDERWVLLRDYGTMLAANVGIGTATSLFQYYAPYQQGVSFAALPGLATLSDFVGLMMMFTAGGAVLLLMNSFLMDFIRYKLIALLPIGIALRSFPFTRAAGATIIAVVAGFYILYPMLFFVSKQMFVSDTTGGFMGGSCCSGSSVPLIGSVIDLLNTAFKRSFYDVFIVAIFLPLFNLTITLTFTREFAKLLGGDVDVSSLTKLL